MRLENRGIFLPRRNTFYFTSNSTLRSWRQVSINSPKKLRRVPDFSRYPFRVFTLLRSYPNEILQLVSSEEASRA